MTHDVEEQLELLVDPILDVESTSDQTHLMLRVLRRQEPAVRLLLVHVHAVSIHLQVHRKHTEFEAVENFMKVFSFHIG